MHSSERTWSPILTTERDSMELVHNAKLGVGLHKGIDKSGDLKLLTAMIFKFKRKYSYEEFKHR
jgi:hypothetical protein